MGNAFTNFLGDVASGVLDGAGDANLRDFQHANRLFVSDGFARAPKLGFLYYVGFNINDVALKSSPWLNRSKPHIGLLVKKIDQPKFSATVETVNQYNRKKLVQTSIKYLPVSVEFHDDNSNITTNLWKAYYQYYFADGNYGGAKSFPEAFADTKYEFKDYSYGLDTSRDVPFFKSIDIYALHQHRYTQYTLINPLITEWSHDSLDSGEAGRILANKMTVSYEAVLYNTELSNKVKKDSPPGFGKYYYDQTPSPLRSGKGASLFGEGGVISGADSLFGSIVNAKSPLDYLGAAIQAADLAKNVRSLSKAGLKQEGYSILKGVLGDVQNTGNQPGGLRDQINSGSGSGVLGSIGNSFKNTSVGGTTTANLSKITSK